MLRRSHITPVVLLLAPISLVAQKAPLRNPPGVTTILSLDSARVTDRSISPDGKWLTYSRFDSDDGKTASIWIASTTNPKPIRLTTPGYLDRWPRESPTGDAIYFVSNRPNRTPRSTEVYVMGVPIDPATGHPTGPIRQVTTDSVAITGNISPDGKWMAYEPRAAAPLKLIATRGGNARTLVTRHLTTAAYSTFSSEGKFVVYQDSGHALRKVPVAGGPPVTLVAPAATTRYALPYPGRDDRYIYEAASDADTITSEVRDLSGRVLAVMRLPKALSNQASMRGDGHGVIGIRAVTTSETFEIKRITLSTGAIQNALPVSDADLVGEAPDGSIVLHHAAKGREQAVTVAPGGKRTEVPLGPEVESVLYLLPGGTKFLAFGKDTVTFVKDFATGPVPLYSVDRITGASHKIADVVEDEVLDCYSRDFESDRHALELAEIHGSVANIATLDGNGVVHPAGAMPLSTFERLRDVASNGNWMAYADKPSKGASAVYLTNRAGAAPIHLLDIQSFVTMAWSPDGRKLAIAYGDKKQNVRGTVRVLDIAANGAATGPGLTLDLGAEDVGYEASLAWLPDGSGIVVDRGSDYDDNVSFRSLDPARPPIRWPDVPSASGLTFEPNGTTALFSVRHVVRGAQVWTADFVPVKQ